LTKSRFLILRDYGGVKQIFRDRYQYLEQGGAGEACQPD